MDIQCQYFSDCGAFGCCSLGVYHNPSRNLCLSCLKNKTYEVRAQSVEPQYPQDGKLPSLRVIISNLTDALKKAIAAGVPIRERKESATLVNICKKCEFYRKSDRRCSKCGCFVQLKTKLSTEHCPINSW